MNQLNLFSSNSSRVEREYQVIREASANVLTNPTLPARRGSIYLVKESLNFNKRIYKTKRRLLEVSKLNY